MVSSTQFFPRFSMKFFSRLSKKLSKLRLFWSFNYIGCKCLRKEFQENLKDMLIAPILIIFFLCYIEIYVLSPTYFFIPKHYEKYLLKCNNTQNITLKMFYESRDTKKVLNKMIKLKEDYYGNPELIAKLNSTIKESAENFHQNAEIYFKCFKEIDGDIKKQEAIEIKECFKTVLLTFILLSTIWKCFGFYITRYRFLKHKHQEYLILYTVCQILAFLVLWGYSFFPGLPSLDMPKNIFVFEEKILNFAMYHCID